MGIVDLPGEQDIANDMRRWLNTAREYRATHLMVVSDDFSYEFYPVYIMPGDDIESEKRTHSKGMQSVVDTLCMANIQDIDAFVPRRFRSVDGDPLERS